jgi:phosphatidylglycerophosphatase A
MSDRLALLLATWFGCGYFPKGPGTAGSIGGLIIAYLLHSFTQIPLWFLAPMSAVLFLPAVWAASRTGALTGRHDPQIVVVDEVIGQWIALSVAASFSPAPVIAAFGLFRLFDIWKPWPVRTMERLPRGWGVIADDAAAGIYAALVLYIGTSLKLI